MGKTSTLQTIMTQAQTLTPLQTNGKMTYHCQKRQDICRRNNAEKFSGRTTENIRNSGGGMLESRPENSAGSSREASTANVAKVDAEQFTLQMRIGNSWKHTSEARDDALPRSLLVKASKERTLDGPNRVASNAIHWDMMASHYYALSLSQMDQDHAGQINTCVRTARIILTGGGARTL